jgi:hypothetical protein
VRLPLDHTTHEPLQGLVNPCQRFVLEAAAAGLEPGELGWVVENGWCYLNCCSALVIFLLLSINFSPC